MLKIKSKIILGLVGEIASGKDTVADYLAKKYNSQTISFSRPLRDILDRLYLPQTRQNMAMLGINLRKAFGQDLLSKVIAEEVKKSNQPIVCLPNVRLESDIVYLKKLSGFYLIHIDTDPQRRYKRLVKRSQNTDDRTKTWAQFLRDSKLSTEAAIKKMARRTKFKIDNNGDFRQLYKQIDEIIKKLPKYNP